MNWMEVALYRGAKKKIGVANKVGSSDAPICNLIITCRNLNMSNKFKSTVIINVNNNLPCRFEMPSFILLKV